MPNPNLMLFNAILQVCNKSQNYTEKVWKENIAKLGVKTTIFQNTELKNELNNIESQEEIHNSA